MWPLRGEISFKNVLSAFRFSVTVDDHSKSSSTEVLSTVCRFNELFPINVHRSHLTSTDQFL